MVVRDAASALDGRPVEIIATDMSESVINRARAGLYSQFEVQRGLPIRRLLQHFTRVEAGWEIGADLRAMVSFRVLNLLDDIAPLGPFDIILCRNLLIYLDRPTKERLLAKLAVALMPDGVLCLGGPESALGLCNTLIPHPVAQGFFLRGEAGRAGAHAPAATAAPGLAEPVGPPPSLHR
jgi:chemotaxis protein methyltransferase CheR